MFRMDGPFYRSHYDSQPSRPVNPVHRKTSLPKVVSIPVHFVGSEERQLTSENHRLASSALKIQKAFRGFLVRKCVKKIASIREEVNEIERRISNREAGELMRRDLGERLRVNETLMALLFKLDSVRGFESGVRDFRKAVIKKAIALQEKVDEIVAINSETVDMPANAASSTADEVLDQATEIQHSAASLINSENPGDRSFKPPGEEPDSVDFRSDVVDDDVIQVLDQGTQIQDTAKVLIDSPEVPDRRQDVVVKSADFVVSSGSHGVSNDRQELESWVEPGLDSEEAEVNSERFDCKVDLDSNSEEEHCVVKRVDENCNATKAVEEEGLDLNPSMEENCLVHFTNSHCPTNKGQDQSLEKIEKCEAGERDDNKCNRELLEKMMEENEKMMTLLTQILNKSEAQSRMLNSLTHRVEQLEKAFLCDKLRRKKKEMLRAKQ